MQCATERNDLGQGCDLPAAGRQPAQTARLEIGIGARPHPGIMTGIISEC